MPNGAKPSDPDFAEQWNDYVKEFSNDKSGGHVTGDGKLVIVPYEDGAPGDNIPGDGYAYDYTNGAPYEEIEAEGNTNAPLKSPVPKARPKDLGNPVLLDLDGTGIQITA